MPFLDVNGLRIHYITAGEVHSPPLLIISGLTDFISKTNWQISDLARDYYVITLDNRSAGLSDHPDEAYTIVDMADDVVGLLDALDVDSAHVFGFSMGGMIALNLALRHPSRVRRLILGCTSAGGFLLTTPEQSVLSRLMNPKRTGDRYQDFLDGMWISFSDRFVANNPDSVHLLAMIAAANPQTPRGYMAQIIAIQSHNVADRLSEISQPTLVMHGDADRLIPPENGRQLAAAIPNARLVLYPDAGHVFFVEQADRVNQDIRAFLAQG